MIPAARAIVAAEADTSVDCGIWIASSSSSGTMRLLINAHPSTWPPDVARAAELVGILDARHLADRADARETADELEALLGALRQQGIEAWLTS